MCIIQILIEGKRVISQLRRRSQREGKGGQGIASNNFKFWVKWSAASFPATSVKCVLFLLQHTHTHIQCGTYMSTVRTFHQLPVRRTNVMHKGQ